MKVIDAHLHFSNIQSFKDTAKDLADISYNAEGLLKEYKDANVVLGIGMGVVETSPGEFPDRSAQALMGLDLETRPKQIMCCIGINPFLFTEKSLVELEEELQKDWVVGIKIYLGYYPYYAYDEVYQPVYRLAKQYDIPVVYHTGDTYAEKGLLKYSHPLSIDEVAVEHRDVRFMMAHFGDPWCLTAAELIYKNRNVFADLSGLIVGTGERVGRHFDRDNRYFDHLRQALVYCDSYDRLLFGTDWPLVQVKPYMEWLADMIPESFHEDFFYHTATRVFPKINKFL
ncbi:amidohydrolase family protein [Alkalicoccobacillus plakortidis]|uniref:Amidohydrolase n=1 Tax=Alkalicoccobacillus plakortidis TaxID=444060 RepID=A0ABT0XLK0_9BACI|nr:amidohydrolase family protein [Alkalicoccobacillus plakortidis]MCM2676790.1 amidohydrolase [Alkalicoccobacillus plakortidis]